MEQPSLINKRKRTVIPVLLQRNQLADSLARTLALLGLDRVPAPVTTLQLHLLERAREEIRKLAKEETNNEHETGDEGGSAG
jgi:hypothetical protein